MNNKWVEELKPGDMVIVRRILLANDRVVIVERVTKTQITLRDKTRFSKRSGEQIGDYRAFPDYLVQASPERLKKIEHARRIEAIGRCITGKIYHKLTPEKISPEKLEALEDVIDKLCEIISDEEKEEEK